MVVLTEGKPPQRGAAVWVAAQVAGGGGGGGGGSKRAAKRQRRDAPAPSQATTPAGVAAGKEGGVDSSVAGEEQDTDVPEGTAVAADAGAVDAAWSCAGCVVAGVVRRGGSGNELLVQVG